MDEVPLDEENLNIGVQAGAGDPHGIIRRKKAGGPAYCLSLENGHPEGAFGALGVYEPYWKWNDNNTLSSHDIHEIKLDHRLFIESREVKGQNKNETHCSLARKKFRIATEDDEYKYLEIYSKVVTNGLKRYYLTERPSPVVRMHVDLDFKQKASISEYGIEAAAYVISKTVHKFFPDFESNIVVLAATYKRGMKETNGIKNVYVKTGVHLLWPSLFVTHDQALNIRESIIADLIEAFGERSDSSNYNSWDEVVDNAIYNKGAKQGSGLRLVGSCKCETCKHCKLQNKMYISKTTGQRCDICKGLGLLEDTDEKGRPRPYMLLCVLGGPSKDFARDLEMEGLYMQNFFKLVLDTKIRTFRDPDTCADSHNHFVMPKDAPVYTETLTGHKRKHTAMARGERHLDPTDPNHLELQTVIRESFGLHYAQIIVRRVTKTANRYKVDVTGSNCRYCQNIGTQHANQNIYFLVTQDGVVQRCYDDGPLDERMKHGRCEEYTSSRMALSARSLAQLWPETSEVMSIFQTDASRGLSMFHSFAMQSLLNAGEYLATTLYNVSWTSTLSLRETKKRGVNRYLPQNDKDLGSKGLTAYRDLGFSWADELIRSVSSDDFTEQRETVERRPLSMIERQVFEAFQSIVVLAANATDPSIFEHATIMDEFMHVGPEDAESESSFVLVDEDE